MVAVSISGDPGKKNLRFDVGKFTFQKKGSSLILVGGENRTTRDPKTHVLQSTPFVEVLVCWTVGEG